MAIDNYLLKPLNFYFILCIFLYDAVTVANDATLL